MSEPNTNVPKFASFRPRPPAHAPLPDEAKAEKKSERKHHSRGKDERPGKDHKRRHHEHRRSRSRERTPPLETKIEPSRVQARNDSVDVFMVDKKGDEKNLVYGSIHHYSVPPFHRFGAGRVLGAPPDMKIDRDFGPEKGIVLSNLRDTRFGVREKYIFSRAERERPRILKIRKIDAQSQEGNDADFVPFPHSRGKKPKRSGTGAGDGHSSSSDGDEREYRSIYGARRAKDEPSDGDFEYATESTSSGSDAGLIMKVDGSIRHKNIELSRKVQETPHDLSAWIALINHQDSLTRTQDDRQRATNAELRSTAEIKIHMFEKALEETRSLKDREWLLLGLMKEGEKIWEVRDQLERWEQISKDNIDSLLLWTSYLNFKQTTFATFRHEDVKEVFTRKIRTLSKAALVSDTEETDSPYQQLIYITLRFTLFLRESGYTELAVSVWQGLLEMNFFAPTLPLSPAEAMESFGAFWESEVPRIGEDHALGWRYFVEHKDASDAPAALIDHAIDTTDHEDLFKTWAAAERLRTRNSRAPARTMDEVAEDDPFRVILFSDIEGFLMKLPIQSHELRNLLLDGFLLFCRLPAAGALHLDNSNWWSRDTFIGGNLMEYDPGWLKEAYFSARNEESLESDPLNALKVPPLWNFSMTSDVIFGLSVWSERQLWKDKYGSDDNGPVSYTWVRNTLKQLAETHFTEDFAEYYQAFEFLNEPLTIKKLSKRLLKQHPSSLRLYNSYALIEWSRGNKDVARSVLSAALNLRGSLSESDWDKNSIILWKSWLWLCLGEQDNNAALQCLLSIADGTLGANSAVSPAALLRSKQHLTSQRDYLLSLGNTRSFVSFSECLMLLGYLTGESGIEPRSATQGDISTALTTCTAFSEALPSHLIQSTYHELFLQSAANLLLHHARIGPFRPAFIREHLTRFIKLFPQNSIFLSLYTWNEARLRIDRRVRNILQYTVLVAENDTLTSRLFAIQYEIQNGTIHSVRSAFEHALSSPSSQSSAGLWRLYILYCLETPQFRTQAKDVWYRALRACPWAKELYLIGFERLSDILPFSELKSVWRIMGEKGLRVHVDLEERFEEMGELESATRELRG